MAFSISDWNLNPNILWFVKVRDIGSKMRIELFTTLADAQAGTNRVASMEIEFGTDKKIVLIEDATYGISYFNDALDYHLKISGVDGDPEKIFQVSPFVDIPDINNSIYRSESLIQKKAINEINKHTHLSIRRDLGIGNHIPALKIGDVIRINSARRSLDVLTILDELTIIGTQNSLINQIGTVEFTDLNYG